MRRLIGLVLLGLLVPTLSLGGLREQPGTWSEHQAAGRKALDAGNAKEAEREFNAAIAALKATGAQGTEAQLAQSYLDLAATLSRQERPKEALPLAEWALQVREAALATDPDAVAQALSVLGRIDTELGEFARAAARFKRAADLIEKQQGTRSFRYVDALLDMGRVLVVTREYDRAHEALSKVLAAPADVLPESHLHRAIANLCLSVMDEAEGKLTQAAAHLEKAEAIYANLTPPDPEARAKLVARLQDVRRRAGQSRLRTSLNVDFGTPTSPVEANYLQVTSKTDFNTDRGYGWLDGKIGAIDRGAKAGGSALTRDINYTGDGTFAATLPAGTYDVKVQLGDLGSRVAHDGMGVFLQGEKAAVVDAKPGEMVEKTFSDVVVGSDQLLKLGLRDQGGNDPYVTIASLSVTPKRTGLRVVSTTPLDPTATSIEYIAIYFNHPVRPESFTVREILDLRGPQGPIKPERVTPVSTTRWVIGFPRQTAVGTYTVRVSPRIANTDGQLLDQNGNGVGGEDPADAFTTEVVLSAVPTSFDFGTATSPLAPAFTRISPESAYSAVLGYGWITGETTGADRGESAGDDLIRDLVTTQDATFAVDLPLGAYDVTVTMADVVAHDQVGLSFQGVRVDTVNTVAGQVFTKSYPVRNATGQLRMHLKDLGGADPTALINGLEIRKANAKSRYLYVATNGNDKNEGNVAHPFKTAQHAVDVASPGDIIYLRGGKHAGPVFIKKPNIALRGYPKEHAELITPSDEIKKAFCVWFMAPGGRLEDLDISGGSYYVVKFEQGNALIQNCKLHHSGRDCVKIVPGADDVTIRKCEIFNSGLRESNADGIDNVNGDRMLVQDCNIHDVVGFGVFGKGGAIATIIERNVIRNALAGIYIGGDSDTSFFDREANPGFYENIDGIVRNNTVISVKYAGIGIQAALRPQVYNNTLIDTAQIGQGCIYIIATTHYEISPKEPKRTTPSRDVTIYNTIASQPKPGKRAMVYMPEQGMDGFLKLDHNRYDNGGEPALFWDVRKAPGFNGGLEKWRSYMKVDQNSTEGPAGLDANHGLSRGSPCIGAGLVVPSVFEDIEGKPRKGRNDIGSHQAAPE